MVPNPDDAPNVTPPTQTGAERVVSDSPRTIDFTASPDNNDGPPPQPGLRSGQIIAGRYTLVEKLGEGGMGEVWVAKQTEPVKRHVALKLIKAGLNTGLILRRFEQERAALALMDHPNIARVLDAGATAVGQPFFAMELVNGLPITQFCDDAKLPPRERLELFIPVCLAVQHAHQKGIVHRDLKPANILVTRIDGRPVPKVIDFGVAKATAGELADESLDTRFGAVVGTLEYMSPEQAGYSGTDIDTRADIYSLGVILYELLTGLRPIDAGRLKQAALVELVRVIGEVEPSRPSTRLSTDEARASLSALRQTEPRQLAALLRGELDWVVMKCLEKQRDRRYQTANGLARDVQRYLADEPVEARPPSARYRFGKFLRRNKATVTAAAAVALALVAGVVGTSWQAWRATLSEAAERRSRLAEVEQRHKAEAAEKRAVAEAATAAAVNEFLQHDLLLQTDARHQAGRGEAVKRDLTIREALGRAAARIGDRFRDQPLAEAGVRQAIARAYASVGESVLALPHMKRAYELFTEHLPADDPRRLDAIGQLADRRAEAGEFDAALALREEAVRRWQTLRGPDDLATVNARLALALHLLNNGRLSEAVAEYERMLPALEKVYGKDHGLRVATLAGLAAGYSRAGRHDQALPLLREVYQWYVDHQPADHPDTIQTLNSLAECYRNMGRPLDALPLHERCLYERRKLLGPGHQDTIQSLNNLAITLYQLGRKSDAVPLMEEACQHTKAHTGDDHPGYLALERNLTQMYAEIGRTADAVRLTEKAYRAAWSQRGPDDVTTAESADALALAYQAAGRPDDARKLLHEALTAWRPKTDGVPVGVLMAELRLALMEMEADHFDGAIALLTTADAQARKSVGINHPYSTRILQNLGVALRESGRPREAVAVLERARRTADGALAADVTRELATAHELAGDAGAAVALRRQLLEAALTSPAPDDVATAAARAELGASLLSGATAEEAETLLHSAVNVLSAKQPNAARTHVAQSSYGAALTLRGKYAEAEMELRRGLDGLKASPLKLPALQRRKLAEAEASLLKLNELLKNPAGGGRQPPVP